MNFTRTFHTVGQGAFYSEVFDLSNDRRFVVVYDCGSYSLGAKSLIPEDNKKLETKINSDLGSPDVDLLFISHFDTDHINGCQFLNPKVVIIPYLSPDKINILSTINTVSSGDLQVDVLRNPEDYFRGAKIVRVQTTDGEQITPREDGIIVNLGSETALQQMANIDYLATGQPVILRDEESVWEYVPYNPNWDKFFSDFRQKIDSDPVLDYKKLNNENNGAYVISHLRELRDIYDQLKNKNSHSLIVYSGPLEYFEIDGINVCCSGEYFYDRHEILYYFNYREIRDLLHSRPGCIYFGDIQITNKWLKVYYDFLKSTNRYSNVGTIQIPHHGAWASRGDLCVDHYGLICVISVGETNSYGHPSARIVSSIVKRNGILKLVTEAVRTVLIETFYCFE